MQAEATSLVDQLEQLPQLRPFPAVATRVLAVCNNPEADMMELAEVMQCDPAMSLQILRIANSAQYGYSGEIQTVEHAIVVLGFRAVRNLALSIAALSVFNEGTHAREARQQLWKHSLGCAAVARLLAPHFSRVTPDEAFLAGIMHDVGKLVFFDIVPDQYANITENADSFSIIEVEDREFGVNHQQVGERCGDEWELPVEISDAITFHHAPQEARGSAELVKVICAANHLAHAWHIGVQTQAEPESVGAEEVCERLQSLLEIDTDLLTQVREEAPNEYQELCRSCGS